MRDESAKTAKIMRLENLALYGSHLIKHNNDSTKPHTLTHTLRALTGLSHNKMAQWMDVSERKFPQTHLTVGDAEPHIVLSEQTYKPLPEKAKSPVALDMFQAITDRVIWIDSKWNCAH